MVLKVKRISVRIYSTYVHNMCIYTNAAAVVLCKRAREQEMKKQHPHTSHSSLALGGRRAAPQYSLTASKSSTGRHYELPGLAQPLHTRRRQPQRDIYLSGTKKRSLLVLARRRYIHKTHTRLLQYTTHQVRQPSNNILMMLPGCGCRWLLLPSLPSWSKCVQNSLR